MKLHLPFRLRAGLANTPLSMALAASLAMLLVVSAAAHIRFGADPAEAAWRKLPQRAIEIAAAIESRREPDVEAMNAWLERLRRDSHGAIAWVRLLDNSGEVEARSGYAVARVDWETDRRILAGQRSYRVVATAAGDVAVAAVPLRVRRRGGPDPVRLVSLLQGSDRAKLLEIGAPLRNTASNSGPGTRDWVNLIASGALCAILGAVLTRRLLLLE